MTYAKCPKTDLLACQPFKSCVEHQKASRARRQLLEAEIRIEKLKKRVAVAMTLAEGWREVLKRSCK